jgi:hypothetical protein
MLDGRIFTKGIYKGSGRDITDVISRYLCGGTDENHEKPFRKAGISAEIQTEHLQNTSPEHCL